MGTTSKDVARQAGVSAATVSMVLRGRPGISDSTRQKVLSAADELGFQYTNLSGSKRHKIIQFVIYKRHGKVVSDTPFFEHMTKGVIGCAQRLGYQPTISYFYGTENAVEQLRGIKTTRCAGLILLATEMCSGDLAAFESLNVPMVLLDNWFYGKSMDSVVIDNRYGAWAATNYLIQCGHTRIGYLHSKVDIHNFVERKDGYLAAVRKLHGDNKADSAHRIVLVGTTAETACDDMSEYLAADPVLPTAFFADNDHIAAGCIHALHRGGYRVPEEISIIGFDGIPVGKLLEPPLTTMSVPNESMGALAVERLDHLIQNETGGEIIRTEVFPSIVERGSVLNLKTFQK